MCLTLSSPEADPETRIYEKWVYYKVFPGNIIREWAGLGSVEGRKLRYQANSADGNFGLIFPCVDHSWNLSFLMSRKGAGVWWSLCLLVLGQGLLGGMEIPRHFLLSLIVRKRGFQHPEGAYNKETWVLAVGSESPSPSRCCIWKWWMNWRGYG